MRDEWHGDMVRSSSSSTHSSQGLTATATKKSFETPGGGDLIAGMTMAARTGRLKAKPHSKTWDMNRREVSARRQVGDAESVVNQQGSSTTTDGQGQQPWWKNVGMGEFFPRDELFDSCKSFHSLTISYRGGNVKELFYFTDHFMQKTEQLCGVMTEITFFDEKERENSETPKRFFFLLRV